MNMSYCRFQNTLKDLQDCADSFDDEDLSKDEQEAKEDMIALMADLLRQNGYIVKEEPNDREVP